MDSRKVLETGTILSFPGMECTIESYIGCGSSAIVYLGSYPDAQMTELRHHVLIKELFPYHPQGAIFRDDNQDICWHADAKSTMELHKRSFNRGNEVHLRLLGDYPGDLDSNINTFSLHNTLYSVLGFSGGRSMDKELQMPHSANTSLLAYIHRILGILGVLEVFHEAGYLHLDISPDNILLIGEGERERVTLIDYNSVHTLEEITSKKTVYYNDKEGYTAPEVRAGKVADIGFASDIYALTAVFYRCLAGKKLSIMQTVSGAVPDISEAECLKGMPDTVSSMVRKILKRGLASLASRRYRDVGQMRLDLEELKDRIEGKGITHWALWEAGRSAALRAVNINPALAYIKDEGKLYPILGDTENGEMVSLEELLNEMVSPGGTSVLLLGSGGAGKTTALLRAAYSQRQKYAGTEPAVLYVSLYGWREQEPSFIKNHILENLRFKPETDSMETARHELMRLLSSPLHTRQGERPGLLLLLDGLNEVSGNMELLLKEIEELSEMPGLRLLLTSRNEIPGVNFLKVHLRPLKKEEVKKALSDYGILPPEKEEMFELLRTPMMLSIFIKAALDQEKQFSIDTRDQLLAGYFSGILEKEVRKLPEEAEERWQIEAALYYVLPEIAQLIYTKKGAVSDRDMLPVVEKSYRRLTKRMMIRIFPQWIGHIEAIRGGTRSGEEWYGRMIHGILWRKLGLLIRNEQGNYQVVHQLIEEYLVGLEKEFSRLFARQKRMHIGLAVVLCCGILLSAYQWDATSHSAPAMEEEVKQSYDETLSENVLDSAFSAYMSAGMQYEDISALLAELQEAPVDEEAYEITLKRCKNDLETNTYTGSELALGYVESLLASGDVMPWSEQPLNEASYEAMILLPSERAGKYLNYIHILEQARADKELWDYFGADYLEEFQGMITSDAYVLGRYYNDVVAPELEGMQGSGREEELQNYHLHMENVALIAGQNRITKDATEEIEVYLKQQTEALGRFQGNGIFKIITEEEE
ncbi:MAG: hypothetical protein J1F02_09350 [Lachnospiraceae bacterium]|nr:hypothetical protein [Lachnospiraceae bacterium]